MSLKSVFVVAASLCIVAFLFLAAPYNDSHASGRPQAEQEIILSIGVQLGDSALELHRVTSAIRLSNGDIVIANGGSYQLRWFDSAGKLVRIVGSRGQGPGEFRGSMFVYEAAADTIVVADGSRRYHYIDASGRFARLDSVGDALRSLWLYDRTIVERTPLGPGLASLRSVISAIPFQRDQVARRAIPDRAGNLWVRDQVNGSSWTGYAAAGRVLGRIQLPPRFELYQVFDGMVLGRIQDSLDVERVQLRRVTVLPVRVDGPASQPRAPYDPVAERAANMATFGGMQSDSRNLITAQEAYFADNGRYAPTLELLKYRPNAGVELTLLEAGERHYWLVLSHAALRSVCVLTIGEVWAYYAACG